MTNEKSDMFRFRFFSLQETVRGLNAFCFIIVTRVRNHITSKLACADVIALS